MAAKPIAITTGEPAGIGPDISLMLAQSALEVPLVALGDPDLLEQRARQLQLPLQLVEYPAGQALAPLPAGQLYVQPLRLRAACTPGQPNPANAAYVLEMLQSAAQGCLDRRFSAMVTAPVHKGIINEAGIPFSGHTEFLAQLTQTPQVVMMLASSALRVALVTTHLPLAAVAPAITPALLESVIRILHAELIAKFGCDHPRILVCGLNPHAGEGGHLGREEIDIINPVLEAFRAEGLDLIGPLPADTLFTAKHLENADAVLAMYHDQGLPVLKYQSFGEAVNITLGLPIIRTSVDHGTAFDLAGTGRASAGSLRAAVKLATDLIATGSARQ